MSTKEKIQVCIVENDAGAYEIFEELFKDNENYDASIIKTIGNDSEYIEQSKDETKAFVIKELSKRSFQILILDFLLRDAVNVNKEKVDGVEYSGIENVLSLEIARQLKDVSNENRFLLLFTSSSEICKTHQEFEEIRDKHGDKIPEDAVFIFKPDGEFDEEMLNCPVSMGEKKIACNLDKRDRNICIKKTCFFQLLDKYYADFMKGDK